MLLYSSLFPNESMFILGFVTMVVLIIYLFIFLKELLQWHMGLWYFPRMYQMRKSVKTWRGLEASISLMPSMQLLEVLALGRHE